MIDTDKIERIAPAFWRNSQLSIAKYAGACIINGVRYTHDLDTDYLVRDDIYKREIKDKRKREQVKKAELLRHAQESQGSLFPVTGSSSGSTF